MPIRVCSACDIEFDLSSFEKKRVGGLACHCPDCSEETAVKHVGVASGDGKQAAVQVLAFNDEQERRGFVSYWQAATGLHTGKNCQIARLPSPRSHSFKKVGEFGGNPNHKGKGG